MALILRELQSTDTIQGKSAARSKSSKRSVNRMASNSNCVSWNRKCNGSGGEFKRLKIKQGDVMFPLQHLYDIGHFKWRLSCTDNHSVQ